MGQSAKQFMRGQKRKRQELPELSREERIALHRIRMEARKHGTILKSAGRGGLPPSLVLHVMRRDSYQCKIHGDRGEGEHGGIEIHHKGHLENPASQWLKGKGRDNVPNNIVTLCHKAHDEIHQKDRAEGDD